MNRFTDQKDESWIDWGQNNKNSNNIFLKCFRYYLFDEELSSRISAPGKIKYGEKEHQAQGKINSIPNQLEIYTDKNNRVRSADELSYAS